ncbi:MAG TPA: hypothetical protein VGN14_04185 [Candidatus Elarobacter sp.]
MRASAAIADPGTSALAVERDIREGEDLGSIGGQGNVAFRCVRGRACLWIVASLDGCDVAALRAGHGRDELRVAARADTADHAVFEYASAVGAFRTKVRLHAGDVPIVQCTTSFLPARDTALPYWPRDLYPLDAPEGTVFTAQRGLRTGIVYAGAPRPLPFSLFYLQDFSALNDHFTTVNRTPADRVGGVWPELGYAPPAGEDAVLPMAREIRISDAYLVVDAGLPATEAQIAQRYLDDLAATYLAIPRPDVEHHDWAARAQRTLRDLSVSPACTFVRRGRRYLMPYVGDDTKPPESMVQLTMLTNVLEYDGWRGAPSDLAAMLHATLREFFDPEVGSVVRWLPGEQFAPSQADAHMSHEAMDSWYLHHALFNLTRLARQNDDTARELLAVSLPFAVRVARRFNYTWPIFFDLKTLDVIQAEAWPGQGGEKDVGGLYALVMIHAHELFGDEEYLEEAKRGVLRLRECGFALGYQMNTTGFAAEAALRLWKQTRDRTFLEISEICLANLFDNMWLWECSYGRARSYPTFFGLFPLRDAPYLAAYEELEALAKFHDYLPMGGEDVRPSLRLLLAEYQRYVLHRGWHYYPDVLPADALAEKARNGTVYRSLSVPLEDLQDGNAASGQVGQELYGAGIAFVFATRHAVRLDEAGLVAWCDYPTDELRRPDARTITWNIGGDPRLECELRLSPVAADTAPVRVRVTARAGEVDVPLRGTVSPEGDAVFRVHGARAVTIRLQEPGGERDDRAVEIGGPRRAP